MFVKSRDGCLLSFKYNKIHSAWEGFSLFTIQIVFIFMYLCYDIILNLS